jgi:dipeptidyl aminopeptidase/acylaminoacyl peptidase
MLRLSGKMTLFVLLFMQFFASKSYAQAQNKAAETSTVVPLIDRELFFNYPEIRNGKLSPDGKMIAFLKASKGVMNIWVKNVNESIGKSRVLTTSDYPLSDFSWTADSKLILFAHSIWENENFNVYAVDPNESVDSISGGTPTVRNLTPLDSVSTVLYQVSRKNPDMVWVGVNNRDKKWYDLYTLEISSGTLKLIRRNKDSITRWIFDWTESPQVGIRYRSDDSAAEFLRLNKDGSSTKIFESSVLDITEPLNFSSDNQWIYVKTNKGQNQDLVKLIMVNLSSMKIVDVEEDPLHKVDLEDCIFSNASREPIFTRYTDDRIRTYFKDSSLESDFQFLQKKYPGREISLLSFSDNDSLILFSTDADDRLPQVYLYDRNQKQVSLQYIPQAGLRPYESHFSKMQSIVYQSSDGSNISGYLTLPRGFGSKNLPVIILPHGGPWSRDRWGFNNVVQWLANRGYAVLQTNFRGSAGFGKKFLNAGNKQWGTLMQDDITWGVNELIGRGIADPKRVGILGANFGGYAVLAGLTFTADVYAAGVDINGPSNLLLTYSSLPSSWSGARKIFLTRVGDTATNAGRNLLMKQSPMLADTSIRTPLMIVYGTNDPMVTKNENDHMVVTMRDSNRKVEYLILPGDSYPFTNISNEMASVARIENFFGKYLRGRSQESMKPETSRRLKEIQQDIANTTVGVALPVAAMASFPTPSSDLATGNYNYTILVEVPGRRVPLAMTRLIMSDSANNWVVTDQITGQTGDQADEATYQKVTLKPEVRRTQQ